MKKLYVRFAGDNDFYYTVEGFVKAIAPRIFYGDWKDITKAQIVAQFNEHAYTMYALHQSREVIPSAEEAERMKEYLVIEEKDVYFDDEVDEFTNFNHDGCLAVFIHHSREIQYTVM